MKCLSLLLVLCFSSALYAAEVVVDTTSDGALGSVDATYSVDQRWDMKRQVMSRPGVMLDMANMTDNGYVWKNDVVWAGDGLPVDEKWYVAGFLFQRPGYKSVWLQYAFRLDESSGKLRNVKRWYGAGSIR